MINTQYDRYTRDQLIELAKAAAMFKLVGGFFSGHIGQQTVRVCNDGSVEVFTPFERVELTPVVDRRAPSMKQKRRRRG